MEGHVDFNLQQFLSEMRSEMHEGFSNLTSRAERIAVDLNNHEKDDLTAMAGLSQKLSAVEGFQSTIKRVLWTVGGAFLVGIAGLVIDLLSNHMK